MIVLITGGSGCGKSTYAERLITSLPKENRVYIATMSVPDEESVRRVRRHRKQREGLGFMTVEKEKDLGTVILPENAVVLLEDLVNLTANEMFSGGDPERITGALRSLAQKSRHLVMVTNDVFSDGIAYDADTRRYLKTLAGVNRFAASLADTVIEVVYSVPVVLKGADPWAGSVR